MLQFLRAEFGDGFLMQESYGAPRLAGMVRNFAPMDLEALIVFTDTLRKLKALPDSNFDKLKKKLATVKQYAREGRPLVELSAMFLNRGFTVCFEPEVNTIKKPDIRIFDPETSDTIYGELTNLQEAEHRDKKSKDYRFLFDIVELSRPPLSYCCQQKRALVKDELPDLKAQILDCKERVASVSGFEIFENDAVKLAFADDGSRHMLDAFANENRLRLNHVQGLEQNFDDNGRISGARLDEKAGQCPPTHNGLVFCRMDPLFFFTAGVDEAAARFSFTLAKYPHVLGVVLFSQVGMDAKEFRIDLHGWVHSSKNIVHGLNRQIVFIENKSAKLLIKDKTFRRISSMFYY